MGVQICNCSYRFDFQVTDFAESLYYKTVIETRNIGARPSLSGKGGSRARGPGLERKPVWPIIPGRVLRWGHGPCHSNYTLCNFLLRIAKTVNVRRCTGMTHSSGYDVAHYPEFMPSVIVWRQNRTHSVFVLANVHANDCRAWHTRGPQHFFLPTAGETFLPNHADRKTTLMVQSCTCTQSSSAF